jgi:hypothetical protein
MSSELVQNLRYLASASECENPQAFRDAADRIEALEKQCAELKLACELEASYRRTATANLQLQMDRASVAERMKDAAEARCERLRVVLEEIAALWADGAMRPLEAAVEMRARAEAALKENTNG